MLKNLIDAAICRKQCDVALKNANVVDVFGGKILHGDVGISGGRIVGVGSYDGAEEYDVGERFVMPGFIDSHVHIESSQLTPEGFASIVVPRGTTTVIADPHEIVNVCGTRGARYIKDAALKTPLEVKLMLPSCVPATPFETSGATLGAAEVKKAIGSGDFFGLGEFMNYPAVIAGEDEALEKIECAIKAGMVCDGHAPALTGKELNAYVCAGISTDHECESVEEISKKLSCGMYVMLRYGSSARNLQKNCAAVTPQNFRRFLICTDDRHAADIVKNGHVDGALKALVASGVSAPAAIAMATVNAAECYGLKGYGAIAPGYVADICVCDDLTSFTPSLVFKGGRLVAKQGVPQFTVKPHTPDFVLNTVKVKEVTAKSFKLNVCGKVKVIGIKAGSILTDCIVKEVQNKDGNVVLKDGIAKLAVIERHGKNGNVGKGLIAGYGIKGGAIGITVSHDSHNLIVAGDDDEDMAKVARALTSCGGGMAVAVHGAPVQCVPLEVAGLMTAAPATVFIQASSALYEAAYSLGIDRGTDAFMSLAFTSLAVIPKLKLLDTGLFDVDKFCFTDVKAD